jgi:hypothetical protein
MRRAYLQPSLFVTGALIFIPPQLAEQVVRTSEITR